MDNGTTLLEVPDNPRLFCLGELRISEPADAALKMSDVFAALNRHVCGEWGELSESELERNDESVGYGGAILSAYRTTVGIEFCVLTGSRRLETVVFLSEEDAVRFER